MNYNIEVVSTLGFKLSAQFFPLFVSGHWSEKSLKQFIRFISEVKQRFAWNIWTINDNKVEQAAIPLSLFLYSMGLRSGIINIYWSIPFEWTHPTIKLFASTLSLNVCFYFSRNRKKCYRRITAIVKTNNYICLECKKGLTKSSSSIHEIMFMHWIYQSQHKFFILKHWITLD